MTRSQAFLKAAADRFGWQPRTQPSHAGSGPVLAYAQYEDTETYGATMVELAVVEVERPGPSPPLSHHRPRAARTA